MRSIAINRWKVMYTYHRGISFATEIGTYTLKSTYFHPKIGIPSWSTWVVISTYKFHNACFRYYLGPGPPCYHLLRSQGSYSLSIRLQRHLAGKFSHALQWYYLSNWDWSSSQPWNLPSKDRRCNCSFCHLPKRNMIGLNPLSQYRLRISQVPV